MAYVEASTLSVPRACKICGLVLTRRSQVDFCSQPCYRQSRQGRRVFWHGQEASYEAVHMWIRRHWKKTGTCQLCHQNRRTQWANDGGCDREDRKSWLELCSACHKQYDVNPAGLLDRLFIKLEI